MRTQDIILAGVSLFVAYGLYASIKDVYQDWKEWKERKRNGN